MTCEGYWSGFVENMVFDRWNGDSDLHDAAGDPVDGAETVALERLIDENPSFLHDTCEFVELEW